MSKIEIKSKIESKTRRRGDSSGRPGKRPAVLVLGGAGYIGSHACKELARAGYLPVTYDSLEIGHRWAVQWGPLEIGDVADSHRLGKVLDRHAPVAAMHFANYAYVGVSVTDPARYYRNNVAGTLTMLEALRAHGVNKVVFSSSCATYGIPSKVPIPEDHAQNPINPYGAAKLMVERILRDFDAAYGLRSVSLRYFNAAGADPDGDIGESHDPETHIIPLTLDAAAGSIPHVSVFGSDYPTPDGTCIRDYIHVTDLARAHVAALDYLLTDGATDFLNLGTGKGVSVKEVIETARRITGRAIRVRKAPRRPGDPPALVAHPGRAAKVLGWRPQFVDIETVIRHAWAWRVKR